LLRHSWGVVDEEVRSWLAHLTRTQLDEAERKPRPARKAKGAKD
jgi:hypothetical protein